MIQVSIVPNKQLVFVKNENASVSGSVIEVIDFCVREKIESCILFVSITRYISLSKDSDYNQVMRDYEKQMELENQYF